MMNSQIRRQSESDEEMARTFFGYGSWSAPYWFIGPEQGKDRGEAEADTSSVQVWDTLGRPEPCDCLTFHEQLGDPTWHREKPLQRTWEPRILALLTMIGKPAELDDRREYQRCWGKQESETCVIDLSSSSSRRLSDSEVRMRYWCERLGALNVWACRPPRLGNSGWGTIGN